MFNAVLKDDQVFLSGRFDASQSEKAYSVFKNISSTVFVDFKDLDYISSLGLGVLLSTQKRLNQTGHKLKLRNLNNHIREVFGYAGFDMIFEIE